MAKYSGFNSIFRFKQFSLQQGPGVFRLGRDAVLLGCWAPLSLDGGPILDVGTGTGILALMAAQRTQREVWGIDSLPESAFLALQNAQSSPWAHRIRMFHASIDSFQPHFAPSDILLNPPYFFNHTPNAQPNLTQARHASPDLPLRWFKSPSFSTMQQGNIHLIVPSSSLGIWEKAWSSQAWFLNRHLQVQGRFQGPIIRSILSLSRSPSPPRTETLYLYESNGERSPAFQALSTEFYL